MPNCRIIDAFEEKAELLDDRDGEVVRLEKLRLETQTDGN